MDINTIKGRGRLAVLTYYSIVCLVHQRSAVSLSDPSGGHFMHPLVLFSLVTVALPSLVVLLF